MTPKRLSERYSDGYKTANWINKIGGAVSFIGACLSLLLGFAALGLAGIFLRQAAVRLWITDILQLKVSNVDYMLFYIIAGLTIVGIVVFGVIGTLISAAGQVVRAVIDTAVNTSPFLSAEEKSDVMQASWWKEVKDLFSGRWRDKV